MKYDEIIHGDCITGMKDIPDNSIDCILTDPPYLYLKNQKLDRPYDEVVFFNEVKRVLKNGGFIVMFGRGTSFYRWNTMLADLGFNFKEEIIWSKGYCTSPLMALSRIHETISIYCKGKGSINRVKVPYLEMKKYDIPSIVTDVKRLMTTFGNPKSLQAVLDFLKNNQVQFVDDCKANNLSVSSKIKIMDRCDAVMKSIEGGCNEKSIISNYRDTSDSWHSNDLSISSDITKENRCVSVMRSVTHGLNEKSIIRTDYIRVKNERNGVSFTGDMHYPTGDRCTNVMQSMEFGLNEKSVIKETPDHYSAIHPTQKPVRLLERLLALVTKEGDMVLDPFSGSGSTAVACINTGRHYIGYEIDGEYFEKSMERLRSLKLENKH
jgi:site-specific DNA-methyltransferase (adenine-specific)